MYRASRFALAGALAVGCTRPQEPAPPTVVPAPVSPDRLEIAGRIEREGLDTTQARDGASDLTFTKATSGTCDPLRLLVHGRDTFLGFGKHGTFARLLPNGEIEDLSLRGVVDEGELVVAVEAVAGDDLYVRTRMQGPVDRYEHFYRRHGGKWTSLNEDMRRNVQKLAPWQGGSVLASGHCYRDNPGPCGGLALQAFGGSTTAPQFPRLTAHDDCAYFDFTADTDGRILASGGLCRPKTRSFDDRWTLVRWSPAGGQAIERYPIGGADWFPGPLALGESPAMLATVTIDERSGERTLVAAFDGAAWALLPPVAGRAEQIVADAGGRPWLLTGDGRLVRFTEAGRWDRLSFPTGPVRAFGGLRDAWAWVLERDGTLWLRPSGGKFARASLRLPEFGEQPLRATQVALVGNVPWVTVMYGQHRCTLLLRAQMTDH